MRALLTAIILLFLVWPSPGQAHEGENDILWQIRPPNFIANLAADLGLGPRRRGLAWYDRTPCVVMTRPPPSETAPEADIRAWLWVMNHELRHCRERRNFHKKAAP